jgi:hypothetical protein
LLEGRKKFSVSEASQAIPLLSFRWKKGGKKTKICEVNLFLKDKK